MALTADGTVWTWGNDFYGQLGAGRAWQSGHHQRLPGPAERDDRHHRHFGRLARQPGAAAGRDSVGLGLQREWAARGRDHGGASRAGAGARHGRSDGDRRGQAPQPGGEVGRVGLGLGPEPARAVGQRHRHHTGAARAGAGPQRGGGGGGRRVPLAGAGGGWCGVGLGLQPVRPDCGRHGGGSADPVPSARAAAGHGAVRGPSTPWHWGRCWRATASAVRLRAGGARPSWAAPMSRCPRPTTPPMARRACCASRRRGARAARRSRRWRSATWTTRSGSSWIGCRRAGWPG